MNTGNTAAKPRILRKHKPLNKPLFPRRTETTKKQIYFISIFFNVWWMVRQAVKGDGEKKLRNNGYAQNICSVI